jgi:hypothetical protein
MVEYETQKLCGVGYETARKWADAGYDTLEKIADSTSEKIAQDMDFDIIKAGKLIRDAKTLISDGKIVYRYWQSEKKTK